VEWQIIDVCIDLVWVWTGSTVPQIEGVTWGNGSALSLKDMTLLFEKVREITFHHRCNKVLPGVAISMCYLWGRGCQGGRVEVWTSQKLLTTCRVSVQRILHVYSTSRAVQCTGLQPRSTGTFWFGKVNGGGPVKNMEESGVDRWNTTHEAGPWLHRAVVCLRRALR